MLFITVGTTSFKELTEAICEESIYTKLVELGYKKVVIQYGSSPPPQNSSIIEIESFAYKPTLNAYMESASLIISHAGSGTILDGLTKKKKMICVVNDKLMDNHQCEIAEKLAELNYIVYAQSPTILKQNFLQYVQMAMKVHEYPTLTTSPMLGIIHEMLS